MSPLAATVAALALYRVTLLVCADQITAPLRDRVPDGPLRDLVFCPWCVSMWLAPPAAGSVIWWGDGWGWWLTAGSLAGSAVSGLLASHAAP